jgi:hypothetical protein
VSHPLAIYEAAAIRLSETTTQAIADELRGMWLAFHLFDGTQAGGRVYDTRKDAVYDNRNDPMACCFLQVPWDHCTVREAQAFLNFNRTAHDQGFRMSDPADDVEPVMPNNLY